MGGFIGASVVTMISGFQHLWLAPFTQRGLMVQQSQTKFS